MTRAARADARNDVVIRQAIHRFCTPLVATIICCLLGCSRLVSLDGLGPHEGCNGNCDAGTIDAADVRTSTPPSSPQDSSATFPEDSSSPSEDTSPPVDEPPETGPEQVPPQIRCGTSTCTSTGSLSCCFTLSGSQSICGQVSGCSGNDVVTLACDDESDCTRDGDLQACCLFTTLTRIMTVCGPRPCMRSLCDPNARRPCPNSKRCTPSDLLPGYHECT